MVSRVVAGPSNYSYQYPTSAQEDGRIELRLKCPSLASFRLGAHLLAALQLYIHVMWCTVN
jgi:hypothetical protein